MWSFLCGVTVDYIPDSGVIKDPPPPVLSKKHILVQSRIKHTAFSDQN